MRRIFADLLIPHLTRRMRRQPSLAKPARHQIIEHIIDIPNNSQHASGPTPSLVALRSLLPPPREDNHSAPFLIAVLISLFFSLETSSPADSRGAKSRRFPCA